MHKSAYQEALALRLRELEGQISVLYLRRQHTEGMNGFRHWWKSKMLERRRQLLKLQLDHISQENRRLVDRMRGSVEGIVVDLSCNFEEFIERLDAKYSSDLAGRQDRQT